MNHFHIYEAIGRGKYSTVYKGREKKSIKYFAIKSVDKSQRTKLLQEVRILHTLDHENVLKFYSWYETSAHLWLILEYCVGGNLMTLLGQDGKLPEESIHHLAYNIVRALQYLHSKGIVYCDLKPSNILLDENGNTKLCDFGLARKLGDISRTPSSMLPQAKRGTPSYMAPELFEDGGVHSYASDFWALGCVLYECYTGRPPFAGREFTKLVKSILSDPYPPLLGSPSDSFVNLIDSLLVKDPAQRIQWLDLCGHAFWTTKLTPVSLPPQPGFDNMIELYAKSCLSEHNGDKPIKTPSVNREKNTKVTPKHDENSLSRGHETPIKGTPGGRKIQTKTSGRVVEEKQKGPSIATRRVNLLRLSRIAKTNLQKENEKENYRRPLPNSSENDAEVKIENTDMELDFNENNEDEGQDDSDVPNNSTCTPEEKGQNQNLHKIKEEETGINVHVDYTMASNAASNESGVCDDEPSSQQVELGSIPPSVSPLAKAQRDRGGSGSVADPDSPELTNNLSDVFWHPSDLAVRPVIPTRKADKISEAIPSLPFEPLYASDFVKMPKEQLETLNTDIIKILNGSHTSILEKQNIIRYLEMLSSSNADAANILTNGPIMLFLVKMLRLSKTPALRGQLASLIGLLIRHSTIIEDDLAHSGIIGSLTDGLRDKNEKVRRFAMAALGELLFYISTQNDENKVLKPAESPSKANTFTSGWQVPNSLISLVSSVLRKGEDTVTQLYALKTIENVCSQGGHWVTRFTSQDVIGNLCHIFRTSGKQESIRLTAGSCLVRLVRFNSSSIQSVIDKFSFKDIASALVKGSSREQQICLNLLNMALLASHMIANIGRHLLSLVDDKNLVLSLISLIEQGSEVLRGKALVFVALLCKTGRRSLPHFFCNARLLSAVDRLAKEKDRYVQQCLDAFVHSIASTVPGLLETIASDIHQMIGGRRHGHISALTGRTASRTNVHLFPVVLHLLGSSSFKNRVVNSQVLRQLANLMKAVEVPFQARDDFQITLLQVLECIADESPLVLQNPDIFILEILPSLTVLYKGNKDGDARFLCLKILFDVMMTLVNEPFEDQQRLEALKSISNSHFLPLYPTLIEDEDPMPTYAQKLLVILIEVSYIKIPDILHLKTVSQCFEFLLGDLSKTNVNNVKLCLALASAPEMESKLLSQMKIVRRVGNLLEFVFAKNMEDFLEPTLGICRAILLRSAGSTKGFTANETVLLGETSLEQQCIRDIADFGNNVGVLLELSGSDNASVAEIASECVVLVLKAAPREATTGFLAHLPKVTAILESWHKGIPHLLLQRILDGLGYSCRQCVLHAMILSISVPEISRIEAVVSEIKGSNVPALANIAVIVASELQRLPRCI